MIFNFFDSFFSLQGQFPDNRLFSILIYGSFSYLFLIIFIKNLIFYFNISEVFFWILLLFIFLDSFLFFFHNKNIIIPIFYNFFPYFSFSNASHNPTHNPSITSIPTPDSIKPLVSDSIDDITTIIV
jgi:hypothetical protein